MEGNKFKSIKQSAFLISAIFLDQISKYIIRIKGGFYICNSGIAFGINLPEIIFFTFFIVLFLFFIIISKFKYQILNQAQNSKFKNLVTRIWDLICHLDFGVWICLILAGGISNIIDRLYFSCVIDFIDLGFWPVFNLADIYITIGAIALMLKMKGKK